jgi:hypothetical protein
MARAEDEDERSASHRTNPPDGESSNATHSHGSFRPVKAIKVEGSSALKMSWMEVLTQSAATLRRKTGGSASRVSRVG